MSIFVCWWVFFFSWLSSFFVDFRHRFKIYRGSGLAFGWARAPPLRPWSRQTSSRYQAKPPLLINTELRKKNTHQQTKILIQRKHVYAYDMPFLCPPNLCAILINRGITIIIHQYMNLFLQEKLIFCMRFNLTHRGDLCLQLI